MTQPLTELANVAMRRTLGDPQAEFAALDALVAIVGASGGRIYSLDLSSGRFVSSVASKRTSVLPSFDARLMTDRSDWGLLEFAVKTQQTQLEQARSQWESETELHVYESRLVIPVVRRKTTVGIVDLHWDESPADSSAFSNEKLKDLGAATQQLANLYEARSVHTILENTAKFRVDLNKPRSVAISNLMKFVGESSGMQYAVLRRLTSSGSLECVASWGFEDTEDDLLTLHNLDEQYPPFSSAVTTESHWIADNLEGDEYRNLRARPELERVRSFIIAPVLTGGSLWGVLSFAASVEYEYSDLEVYSLRALANLAGVALEAFNESDNAAEARYDDGRLMQAVLSNEIISATRHEMYDQLAVLDQVRRVIGSVLRPHADPAAGGRLTRNDIELLVLQADAIDAAHSNMQKVWSTVRFAQSELSSPPAENVNVLDVWRRAVEPFGYRIARSRIADPGRQNIPPSLTIVGSSDWLRIVFMQLLLNSLDAFDARRTKGGGRREIILRVAELRDDGTVVLRYVDNAGGISPGTLRKGGELVSESPRSAVFERFVTSKEKGTGLGLASCRAALGTMDGSIDLIDWKSGVTFDLELKRGAPR